jgi:hypothetical protein
MSNDEKSLDLTGVGKLAKAIPPSSWNKIVKTACDTFTSIIAPITATTTGLGRLIQAKFDGMVDAQKVLAADAPLCQGRCRLPSVRLVNETKDF